MLDCFNDDEFILARIAAIEAMIIALETAIIVVTTSGTSSYSFDDGQTRQTVTRLDLASLEQRLNSLMNQRSTLLASLGRGQAYVRPGF